MPEILITAKEVAALFGVHVGTVHEWGRRGLLASIVLPSGQRRYRRSDVDAILRGDAA